jgi:hypothetical protein
LPQRRPGLDHVSDDIGHAQPDGSFDRAIQGYEPGADTKIVQIGLNQPCGT